MEHLTSHDLKRSNVVFELYEQITTKIPIFHPEDLKERHAEFMGSNSESDIKKSLNQNETQDMLKFNTDMYEWAE